MNAILTSGLTGSFSTQGMVDIQIFRNQYYKGSRSSLSKPMSRKLGWVELVGLGSFDCFDSSVPLPLPAHILKGAEIAFSRPPARRLSLASIGRSIDPLNMGILIRRRRHRHRLTSVTFF